MIDWLKSIFGSGQQKQPVTKSEPDDNLLERFEAFLAERMQEFRPSVHDAFITLFKANLTDDIKGLHIEIFMDDPAFSFRLFSQSKDDVWTGEPAPVQAMNETIDRLWPIVTEDELDQYTIWEDDPKWGRQVALEQPLDKLSIPQIVIPWFKKIVSETRGDFSRPVTASVHDITMPEEL